MADKALTGQVKTYADTRGGPRFRLRLRYPAYTRTRTSRTDPAAYRPRCGPCDDVQDVPKVPLTLDQFRDIQALVVSSSLAWGWLSCAGR